MEHLVSKMMLHPHATVLALLALIALTKGVGNPFGPPRPVARRFLTRREQAMLATLERVLPHCRIHA